MTIAHTNVSPRGDDIDDRVRMLSRNLTGRDGLPEIAHIMSEGRAPKGFWATAPTGRPHIAYFVPLLKLADFATSGCDVSILFCDLYAFLVNAERDMDLVLHRTAFYKLLLRNVLRLLGVPDEQVHFVDGSAFELRKEVTLDFYRLSAMVDVQELRDCGSEYRDATRLSTVACPALPGLAEEYLDSDFQFGGEDQAGLFAFNERYLPRLGYRKRAHLMNPMIAGLQGTKMSSSVENSKIEFLDDEETIRRKIDSSVCMDGVLKGNGLLPMIEHIVLPLCRNRAEKQGKRAPLSFLAVEVKDGGSRAYSNFSDLEIDFVQGNISSICLKAAVGGWLAAFLAPLRKVYEENQEWRKIEDLAYSSK